MSSGEVPPATASMLVSLGPFFSVQPRSAGDAWQPLSALMAGPLLDEQVRRAQGILAGRVGGPVETRVAASITSLGLFSRLLSPYLGAAAAGLPLPAPEPQRVHIHPAPSQPWPLHLSGPIGQADPQAALDALVQPLIERIADRFSVSPIILRGNAASGVFGAVGVIRRARPDLASAAHDLGHVLLDGPLAGTGASAGSRFVRASCCLLYRIPGCGYCGDCVLAHR